jgi:hypothetical protein
LPAPWPKRAIRHPAGGKTDRLPVVLDDVSAHVAKVFKDRCNNLAAAGHHVNGAFPSAVLRSELDDIERVCR